MACSPAWEEPLGSNPRAVTPGQPGSDSCPIACDGVKLKASPVIAFKHHLTHSNFEVRPPERYTERFWCDQSPSWTVTAHMEQGCGGLHSHVLWSGLHLGPCFLVLSLPGFQVFLQAWLLDALQGTNTSDFPYDAQYGHWRHPKWQLY